MSDRREEALEQAREELKDVDRDQVLAKAVKQLQKTDESLKKEAETFRNWYSLHFPELEQEIDDDRELLEVVSRAVDRDKLDSFEELAESSKGMDLPEEDLKILQDTAGKISRDHEYREQLESYIEKTCEDEMPNLSTLLEPVLTAKLVSLSGGLEDLAESPASTIQMLGAESALFRHLSGEGSAPKHGVLFEHRFVHSLPEEERGKMARFLANKAAIAARLDLYGDKEKGRELREKAQEKFEELEG